MKKFIIVVLLIVTCCFLFACQSNKVVARLSFGPENPLEKDANELTGDRFFQEEHYQKAISSYERAIKAYEEAFGVGCEQSLEQIIKIIDCYIKLEEYEKAKEKCNELETANMVAVYDNYLKIAYAQVDYETAIYYLELNLEEYSELDTLNSYRKVEVYYLLADANKKIGNFEEALKCYQSQLDLELYYHSVWNSTMLGEQLGYQEQLSALMAAIDTYINIGDLYGSMGDKENSLKYLYYAYGAAVEYQEHETIKPLLEEAVLPKLRNYYLEDTGSEEGFESWLISLEEEYKQE